MNILTLGAANGGMSYSFLIIVIVMIVAMYFMSVRPQRKQQQKRAEMLQGIKTGDKVMTLGGVKGVVHSINRDNKEVVVDCDGIYLTFDLNFIRQATPADNVKPDATKNEKKESAKSEDTKAEEPKEAESKADDSKIDDAKPAEDTKETTETADKTSDTEESKEDK